MITINSKQFVIMALLSETHQDRSGMHPYRIEELIKKRNMREWTKIGKSSIYRILDELEKLPKVDLNDDMAEFRDKLVVSYPEEVDGRTRRIYALTTLGWEVLKDKIFEVLSNFLSRHDEEQRVYADEDFYIAFTYIGHLPKRKQLKALNSSIGLMKDHIKYLKERLDESKQHPFCVQGLFLHPIMILKVDIEFLELAIDKIQLGEMDFNEDK